MASAPAEGVSIDSVLDTEMFWTAPGHVTARWRNVFIQVRAAELTVEVMASIEMGARLTRAQLPRAEPYGAMIVILPGAPHVVGEVAKKQRELLANLGGDERLHLAVVLEGDSVAVMAQQCERHRCLQRHLAPSRRWDLARPERLVDSVEHRLEAPVVDGSDEDGPEHLTLGGELELDGVGEATTAG
jgi:hypothetical protein